MKTKHGVVGVVSTEVDYNAIACIKTRAIQYPFPPDMMNKLAKIGGKFRVDIHLGNFDRERGRYVHPEQKWIVSSSKSELKPTDPWPQYRRKWTQAEYMAWIGRND